MYDQNNPYAKIDSSGWDHLRKFEADRVCTTVGEALVKGYPGYKWFVNVNLDGGIVNVQLPTISSDYGMTIHLDKHTFALEQAALNAGGELLERFNLTREANTNQTDAMKRDLKGNLLGADKGEYAA